MDNNNWSDSLKRRMEAHTEAPPAGLWGDIERRMELAAAARVRRRRVLSWSIGSGVAAAVALLLVFVSVMMFPLMSSVLDSP